MQLARGVALPSSRKAVAPAPHNAAALPRNSRSVGATLRLPRLACKYSEGGWASNEVEPIRRIPFTDEFSNLAMLTGTILSIEPTSGPLGTYVRGQLTVNEYKKDPVNYNLEIPEPLAEDAARLLTPGCSAHVQGPLYLETVQDQVTGAQLLNFLVVVDTIRFVESSESGPSPMRAPTVPAPKPFPPFTPAPAPSALPAWPQVTAAATASPVAAMTSQQTGTGVISRDDNRWEDLFANPQNYWDNRMNKKNPRGPDFKHKNIDVPLWLDSFGTPPWVKDRLEELPPPPAFAGTGVSVPASEPASSLDDNRWEDLFANPQNYWDNRMNKKNPRAPDFKHKNKDVPLWLVSFGTPLWVKDRLEELPPPPPPPPPPAFE